ncbi:MAG: LysR family transcriptional regulator [bacterium]
MQKWEIDFLIIHFYNFKKITLELRQLRTFCAVVECKSFSKASKRVYLSQPTVSLQIKS